MGNSAIIVVVASVLSAVTIFFNIAKINTDSNIIQSQLQEEVLARELAHSGLNIALARLYDAVETGRDPSFSFGDQFQYGDGTIRIGSLVNRTNTVEFKVLGQFGEAQYMISSEYNKGASNGLECVVCVDAGIIQFDMEEGAKIRTEDPDLPANEAFKLGTEEYNRIQSQPGLGGLYDMSDVVDNVENALDEAWEGLSGEVTEVDLLDNGETFNDILPDIDPTQDIPWLQEFYFTTLDRMDFSAASNDAVYPLNAIDIPEGGFAAEFGSLIPDTEDYGRNYSFGTPDNTSTLRVKGDMVVRNGSTLGGTGTLIVEGDLIVEPGATLNWDGILYLRPEKTSSTTKLEGTVNINGALLAYQEAIPPGSHMDVTTNRDLTANWYNAAGTETSQPGIPIAGPWFVHIHRWDKVWNGRPAISDAREIIMRRGGSVGDPNHEASVRFHESMNAIANSGNPQIYLEFVNPSQSGMGVFNMAFMDSGVPVTFENSIAAGFNGKYESPIFRASELRDFGMHIRSVRFLQLMRDPDPEGSSVDGAQRVALSHDRKGSFHVAVREANPAAGNPLLMTTSVYQHIREDESEEFEEELQKLRDEILNGDFGLTIEMSPGATLRYDREAIANAFSEVDPLTYTHERTWTQRCNGGDFGCNLTSFF